MITVAVINETSKLSEAEIAPVVAALQIQVSEHFAPIWGVDAKVVQVKKGETAPKGSWWLVLVDFSDVAGAYGYHDTTVEGLPLGKVAVETTRLAGGQWSVTASHELLEMLADPDISTCVEFDYSDQRVLFSREVCDPCEADQYGYKIGEVLVSDFIKPTWFHRYAINQSQDYCGKISQPFLILPDGYMSIFDPSRPSLGWHDINANGAPVTSINARARVGSRRERRRLARSQWLRSQPNGVL